MLIECIGICGPSMAHESQLGHSDGYKYIVRKKSSVFLFSVTSARVPVRECYLLGFFFFLRGSVGHIFHGDKKCFRTQILTVVWPVFSF